MRVRLLLALILLTHIPLVYAAQNSSFNPARSIQVKNRQISSNSMNIEVSINDPVWQTSIQDGNRDFAYLPGEDFISNEGQPQVPVDGRLVRLPATGGARVEIISAEYETLTGLDYARYFEDNSQLNNLDEIDDSWYPENIVSVGDPAILHDFRVASINTCPIQVNQARHEVRVYNNINYTIHFDTDDSRNELPSYPTALSEAFLPYYRELLDWSEFELDDFTVYRGNVIVLVQDNANTLNTLAPWLEWKRQKGWKLELITDSDVTWSRNAIRAELINRYSEAEVKFDNVVIIGDATGSIICPPGTFENTGYEGAGDLGYSTLAGDDDLVDVAVGRISVNSLQQLNIYVNKVLCYEKTPYMDETDWYKEGLVAAGSVVSGVSTIFTCEYAREKMYDRGYNEVHTAYYNDGLGDVNQRITNTLNEGVGFHVYRGLAGTGLDPVEVGMLQNNFKTPPVIDITCGRGDWGNDDSVNEAYMRAGTNTTPRGGIGCISTATSNTHTRFNNSLTGGAIEALLVHELPTLGSMIVGAKLNLWNNLHTYDPTDVLNFSIWTNLMGDPTVWIYTDIPRQLSVAAETEINVGQNGYEVTVIDNMGAVEGAWVTLYRSDEDEEVIGHGVTDDDGTVRINALFNYSGTAVLTVTANNAHPFIQNVSINSPNNMLGYTDVTILDDGTLGTSGNGNGLAEYGETVGLQFTIHNFGQNSETNINYSFNSDDEAVVSISGSGSINSLASGGQQETSLALVEISEDVLDHYEMGIDLHLQNANGDYWDSYALEAHAPFYTVEPVDYYATLIPGASGNIGFRIINNGSSQGEAASLHLSSEDSWINITTNSADLIAVDPGALQVSEGFDIEVAASAFQGYQVKAILDINFEDGRTQSIPVKIGLGQPEENDPLGPDNYGYIAYDNIDNDHDLAQSYNWVELSNAYTDFIYNGQLLNLQDTGPNADESVVVDLPFDFTYYGGTYDQITICSNGWLAMGDQGEMALQRNWSIPTPLGPDAMIAPFWDDRITTSGGIYYYASAEEGRVIIEWDNVSDALQSNPCTFQAILYEAKDDNPSGDGEIYFQYKQVNASIGNMSDIPYWTTGIENHTQEDGLQVVFYHDYAPASGEIEDNTSILFSTKREQQYGTVTGTVTDGFTNEPLEGVRVSSAYLGTTDLTDANGQYSIQAAAGENCIVFSKPYYETTRNLNVNVVAGGSVVSDAQIAPPSFQVSPEEIDITIGTNDQVDIDLTVTNAGETTINYDVFVTAAISDTGASGLGYPYATFNMFDYGFDFPVRSISFDGEALWLLESMLWEPMGYIHRFSLDGELLFSHETYNETISIQWVDGMLVTFDFDGIRYYQYVDGELQLIDENMNMFGDFGFCYQIDPEQEHVYQGTQWSINKYDMEGNLIDSFNINQFIASICFVPDDESGKSLHYVGIVSDQNIEALVSRMTPDGEGNEAIFQIPFDDIMSAPAISVFANPEDLNYTIATTFFEGLSFRNYLPRYQLGTLSASSGTVNPGDDNIVTVSFDGSTLPAGTLHGYVLFTHDSFGGRYTVPITVNSTGAKIDLSNELPDKWALDKVWPNPFNPTTNISFSLLSNTMVEMKLYNIMGQEVKTLINQPMNAGNHTLTFDGTSMASGIYFLKMKAGPINEVRKLMLVK